MWVYYYFEPGMDEPIIRIFTKREGAVAAFKEAHSVGDPDWLSGNIDHLTDWYWTDGGAEARIQSIIVE